MKEQDKKYNLIKNKSSVLVGGGIALLNILFLTGFFQALAALILGVNNFYFEFNYLILKPIFHSQTNASAITYGIIYFSPLVFNILLMEIGSALLKKTTLGYNRFLLIFFNLVIAGYLIISVFYGAIVSIVVTNSANDWNQLMINFQMSEIGKIIFMFAVIFMLTTYLQQTAKRILEYIN